MSSEVSISDGLLERLPPQSIEAEQAVLGALLVSGDGISRVVDVLDPDYFYRKAHQVIYAAMLDLYENNEPIDIVTVSQYLKDEEKLEHVGGRQYITDLALAVATTANLEYYAKVVQEKALLRQLIKAGTEIVGSCYEEPDANIAIDRAEHLIFTLAERRNMQQLVHIKHIVEASFQRIEQRYEQRDSLSGIPSGFYDLDALTSGFQPSDLIIVAARPSMGKCLAYDSELVLADGSIATIEEIYRAKEARLLTLSDDLKLNWTQPSAFVDDGIKPVFRVVTRLGRTIETTLPHPFLTLSGWKKLSELKAGDKIALPRGIPVFGKHSMRECEVKLLAYLIGDGCLTNGKVSFTNSNPRIQEEFCQAVSEFGSVVARREESRNRTPSFVVKKNYRKKHRERKQLSVALKTSVLETFGSARKFALAAGVSPSSVCHWTKGACIPSSAAVERIESTLGLSLDKDAGVPISSLRGKGKNAITQWLEKLDLMGKGAHDKIVPAQIFRLQKEQIALFLNRLFATDGWATVLNSGQSQFGYCTVSERLARQISHLLLRFNIICKVRTRKIKYGAEQCVAYQLDITDKESIERFCNEIGIFGKEEAVERVRNQIGTRRYQTNLDLLPSDIWREIASKKGSESWASLARRSNFRGATNIHVGKRSLSRKRLNQLAISLNDERLRHLAQSDVYWDRIESIDYVGDKQVYDLTIPETHNFVANDICVHNTALCLNIAQHVAVETGTPVAVFSLEMSKEQLVMRMLCSEANIDANRLRTGHLHTNDWTALAMAMGRLGEAPIFIDDSALVNALEIRAKARRLKAEMKGLGLIIIDYIQLLQGRKQTDNRVQEVSEISRSLKTLARELNVPVIALSQLSRAVEARQNKRPMLSDLRESGCLTGDTKIYLPDEGGYRRIDSLVGQSSFNVLAVNPTTWRLERKRVVSAFSTGHKPVYKLTTRLGRTIRATANHKFLTLGGWQQLDELAEGMRIATPRERSISLNGSICKEPALVGIAVESLATMVQEPEQASGSIGSATGADSDVYWDIIDSIEPDGMEDVYDLTVEDLHNFVANNIIVHNSIEQDADLVMFIYRDEYYNPESDRRGEAEIIIAKQRNGPTGTVDLLYQSSVTRFLNKVHNQYTAV